MLMLNGSKIPWGYLSDYVIFSNLIMRLRTPQKIINKLLTRFFLLLI